MDLDPVEQFRKEVQENFRGVSPSRSRDTDSRLTQPATEYQKIKGPFNAADRLTAGMSADYYTDLEGFAVSRWQASSGKEQDKLEQSANVAATKPELSEDQRRALQQTEQEGDLRIHPRLT